MPWRCAAWVMASTISWLGISGQFLAQPKKTKHGYYDRDNDNELESSHGSPLI
jgi:hypothetical protein